MRQWESLVGKRYGSLVVVAQADSKASGKRRWHCQCDCGNTSTVNGYDLTHGKTVSCGCRKTRNLVGQRIGRLTVLERSDQYAPRGKQQSPLWLCRCDCGALTYKTTNTLSNHSINMCKNCAGKYNAENMREKSGYLEGTQLARIRNISKESANSSGIRGVYYEKNTGKYRARIKFKGKLYNLGSYHRLEEAVEARKRGEAEIYGSFLETLGEK